MFTDSKNLTFVDLNGIYILAKMNGELQHMFTWKIINVSLFENVSQKPLVSPQFKADNINELAIWKLYFYPTGEKEPLTMISSCYIQRVDESSVEEIACSYALEILSSDGDVVRNFTDKAIFRKNSVRGVKYFFDIIRVKSDTTKFLDDTITIRCHMKGKMVKESKISRNFAETKIGFDRIAVEWKIENISNMSFRKSIVPVGTNLEFELLFLSKDEKFFILVTIRGKIRVIKVVLKVCLVDTGGNKCLPTRFEHLFTPADTRCGSEYFNAKREVDSNYHKYILRDTLTLICEISASNDTQSTSMSEYQYCPSICEDVAEDVDTVAELIGDLKKMYKYQKYTDVVLLTKDLQPVNAHKAILSARSEYFYKIFEDDIVNKVPIAADLKTLNLFLEYMYTGEMEELDLDSVDTLIELGENYKIESLADDCKDFRNRKLSEGNVTQFSNKLK